MGNDTGFCAGENLILDAGSGYTYLWNDNSNTSTLLVDSSGIYWVEATDTNGCNGRDSITITVFPLPIVALPDDTSICSSQDFLLDAGSGFVVYQWSDSSFSQTLLASTSGDYSVTVTDANGCQDNDSIHLFFSQTLNAVLVSPDTAICEDETVQLWALGGVSYSWLPDATLDNPASGQPIASPQITTTYFVTTYDSLGCSKTDSVRITVLPKIVAQALADTIVCAGESLQLSANGGTDYFWFPSSGLSCVSCPTPLVSPENTTLYSVAVSQPGACNSDTATVTVSVRPLPEPGLDSIITLTAGTGILLTPNSDMISYQWSPPFGLNCNDCGQPFASPDATTLYLLTITDSFHCSASKEILINVLNDCDSRLTIPSAFSPNGDGINDIFRVIHRGEIEQFDFKVFNRWGELVFETTNPNDGWDGYHKGSLQELAVYAYYVRHLCSGKERTIIGNVTLVH